MFHPSSRSLFTILALAASASGAVGALRADITPTLEAQTVQGDPNWDNSPIRYPFEACAKGRFTFTFCREGGEALHGAWGYTSLHVETASGDVVDRSVNCGAVDTGGFAEELEVTLDPGHYAVVVHPAENPEYCYTSSHSDDLICHDHAYSLAYFTDAGVTCDDRDDDGIPNEVEEANGLDPLNPDDAALDPDGDRLSHAGEYLAGTHMRDPDTDGDGVLDGDEVARGMNPLSGDTDGDLVPDAEEVARGMDPLSGDTDGDGLGDLAETDSGVFLDALDAGTDPLRPDTDGDLVEDGVEVRLGSHPLDPKDSPPVPTRNIELQSVAGGLGGFVVRGIADGDASGTSVSGAGDVNRDGYADLIVGAPGATPRDEEDAGEGYVVFGSSRGVSVELSDIRARAGGGYVLQGGSPWDGAGWSVSGAGDVNGDGRGDVIVGVPSADNSAGATYVVFGKSSFWRIQLEGIARPGNRGGFVIRGLGRSGWTVSGAGDVNGDGLDDVVVGTGPSEGLVSVVFGKRDGAPVELANIRMGHGGGFSIENGLYQGGRVTVSGAGDINGDGLGDLVIGRPREYSGAGASYIVFGKSDSAPVSLPRVAEGEGGFVVLDTRRHRVYRCYKRDPFGNSFGVDCSQPHDFVRQEPAVPDHAGSSVSGAGDVNGDGLDDIVVSASAAKRQFIVFGKSDGAPVELADVGRGRGGFSIEGVGGTVSDAGDINGDGLDDVVILGEPSSYVVFGKADGAPIALAELADTGEGGIVIHGSAASASAAGDVNGDGVDDLVLGAPDVPGGGASYVIFGYADCNGNGVADSDDLQNLTSEDCDGNGIPDECETPPALFEASLAGVESTIRAEPGASVATEIEFQVLAPCFLDRRQTQLILGLGESAIQCIHDGLGAASGAVEATFTAPMDPGEYPLYVLYEEEVSCDEALALYSEERALSAEVLGQRRGQAIGTIVVALARPPPRFRRGDANVDGEVDISDAIMTLGALFLGDFDFTCRDAGDANDDGGLDISDAISTMGVLFLGTETIPAPGMNACGVDPTEDAMGCDSYEACP